MEFNVQHTHFFVADGLELQFVLADDILVIRQDIPEHVHVHLPDDVIEVLLDVIRELACIFANFTQSFTKSIKILLDLHLTCFYFIQAILPQRIQICAEHLEEVRELILLIRKILLNDLSDNGQLHLIEFEKLLQDRRLVNKPFKLFLLLDLYAPHVTQQSMDESPPSLRNFSIFLPMSA
jgi:hypothetical protein